MKKLTEKQTKLNYDFIKTCLEIFLLVAFSTLAVSVGTEDPTMISAYRWIAFVCIIGTVTLFFGLVRLHTKLFELYDKK